MSRYYNGSLLALLACFSAHAAEKLVFTIDRRAVEFIQDDTRRLMLSSGCATGEAKSEFRCQAFEALARASLKPVSRYLKGGKNPGAVICREELKAQVEMGLDSKGNQNSFCKFPDGSLIDNGSLANRARANDQR